MNKYVGEVLELFISEEGSSSRISKKRISLNKKGVIGDKFYSKDSQRAVLLTGILSYNLVKENNIKIPYGTLGENILLSYNPYSLSLGKKLRIGSVVIKISKNCTICNHLSVFDKKIPLLLKNDRGIFIEVIDEGVINKGDKVYLLD